METCEARDITGESISHPLHSLFCEAVIFDLDGVLVDSNGIAERHWRLWASRRGIDFEMIARSHHGRPTVQTMREVAPELDVEFEARLKEDEEADDTDGLVAFPGAHRILTGLPPDRWAIVTSGTRRTAQVRLQHTLLPVPQTLVTADDITHGKPHPEPYLKGMKSLNCSPEKCLIFEDAPAGVRSARAAGARVIAITSTNPESALSGADVITACLDDIQINVLESGLEVLIGTQPLDPAVDASS